MPLLRFFLELNKLYKEQKIELETNIMRSMFVKTHIRASLIGAPLWVSLGTVEVTFLKER